MNTGRPRVGGPVGSDNAAPDITPFTATVEPSRHGTVVSSTLTFAHPPGPERSLSSATAYVKSFVGLIIGFSSDVVGVRRCWIKSPEVAAPS
ncbi:hypothetical protein MycrhN_2093 [Mycolicibacterium rhodesiae NBB3]|uniref:Uncharacterized protein n=1 Tax=Mycolicibacterium rhodesiae (strain NBB3) TaxID=710685 RepID=G8RQT9_MYCRN|nr:hypothetical protein MycrhN_2093 [Mycolicibacterium rhodesiae NBB3]